jgi:hypothetical protein
LSESRQIKFWTRPFLKSRSTELNLTLVAD